MVSLFGVAALFGGGITTAYNFGKTVEQKFLTSTLIPTPTPHLTGSGSSTSVIPIVVNVSKAGTIKATYSLPSSNPTPTVILGSPGEIGATPGSDSGQASSDPIGARMAIPPSPTSLPLLHYILVSKSGSIIFLSPASIVNLQNYLNLKVLVTGNFDSVKNTLRIVKSTDIEILQ